MVWLVNGENNYFREMYLNIEKVQAVMQISLKILWAFYEKGSCSKTEKFKRDVNGK